MTEINFITMELTEQCLGRSKPSRNGWRFVREPHTFRWISSSNGMMAWLWEAITLCKQHLHEVFWEIGPWHNITIVLAPLQGWHICGLALGPEWLQNFLSHCKSLRLSTQFTIEESGKGIPFLDVQVIRKDTPLVTMSTENPLTMTYTLTSIIIILHIWKEV